MTQLPPSMAVPTAHSTLNGGYYFNRKLVLWIVSTTALASLLGWGSKRISLMHHSNDENNLRFLQNTRNRPDKGDSNDCISNSGYPMPCHGPNYNGDDNLEGASKLNPWDPRLPNTADVTVYVGLQPGAKSISHTLAKVVTLSLNDLADSMGFFLPQHFDDEDNMDGTDDPWESGGGGGNDGNGNKNGGGGGGGGENGQNGSATSPQQDRGDGGGQRRNEKNRNYNTQHRSVTDSYSENRRTDFYDMYFSRKHAKLIHRGEKRWWWRYTFAYNCFWGGTYDPVPEPLNLGESMTALLSTNREIVRTRLAVIEGDPGIRISTNQTLVWVDEEATDSSSMDDGKGITNGDTDGEVVKTSDPSYLQPVDSSVWNWQRYAGLGLLLFVSLISMCLVQLSAMRRRRRIRKQVWSNLASEEGVKDLLRSGWIVKGNRMKIFDKSKLGYRDDSSILVGGFEQKEPVIGSEITCRVSRENSTKTQETRNTSSHDFVFPSSQTNLSSSPRQFEEKGGGDASALGEKLIDR